MSSFDDVENNSVYNLWVEAKALLESAEVDLVKGCKGNVTAATRARKAFRTVREKLADANRTSLVQEKARKLSK